MRGKCGIYRAAKQRLASDRGASVTFALLLFLVCAVTGSVILTAGSAAAGRLAQTARMDQRYYSVTSAAALLKQAVEDAAVVIEKTTEAPVVTSYDLSGNVTGSSPEEEKVTVQADGADISDGFTPSSLAADAAERFALHPDELPFTREMELTASGAAEDAEALSVTVRETLDADGTMHLYLIGGDAAGEQYTLHLTFLPEDRTDTTEKTVSGTPENVDSSGYTIRSVTTKTETHTMHWTLSEIRTIAEAGG